MTYEGPSGVHRHAHTRLPHTYTLTHMNMPLSPHTYTYTMKELGRKDLNKGKSVLLIDDGLVQTRAKRTEM